MPRKKNGDILDDSINMPINGKDKKEIVEYAQAKGISHTSLARKFVLNAFAKVRRQPSTSK